MGAHSRQHQRLLVKNGVTKQECKQLDWALEGPAGSSTRRVHAPWQGILGHIGHVYVYKEAHEQYNFHASQKES